MQYINLTQIHLTLGATRYSSCILLFFGLWDLQMAAYIALKLVLKTPQSICKWTLN